MVGKLRSEKLIADKELIELNEANDILSDPIKRQLQDINGFDEYGNVSKGCSRSTYSGSGMQGGMPKDSGAKMPHDMRYINEQGMRYGMPQG